MTDRPDVSRIWASSAPSANIQDPDKFNPGKVIRGWDAEIPPFEWYNWVQNVNDLLKLALVERGVNSWGPDVTYLRGSLSFLDDDGFIYIALQDNTDVKPNTDLNVWERSAVSLSQKDFDDLLALINQHIADATNPHEVTAEQVGAYTKAVIDIKLGILGVEVSTHIADASNPHKVTIEQVGGVPKTGGTFDGAIATKATQFEVAQDLYPDAVGLEALDEGIALMKGDLRLGISKEQVPYFKDGSGTINTLLYETNFATKKLEEEPKYSVPRPDYWVSLVSDLHILEGVGSTEFSRASTATYINKQGIEATAEKDEACFGVKGLYMRGSETYAAGADGVPRTRAPENFIVDKQVIQDGDWTLSICSTQGNGLILVNDVATISLEAVGTGLLFKYLGQEISFDGVLSEELTTIVVTRVADVISVSIQGQVKSITDATPLTYGTKMYLGCYIDGSRQLNGFIRSFRTWNMALTTEQISTL